MDGFLREYEIGERTILLCDVEKEKEKKIEKYPKGSYIDKMQKINKI